MTSKLIVLLDSQIGSTWNSMEESHEELKRDFSRMYIICIKIKYNKGIQGEKLNKSRTLGNTALNE